MIPRKQDGSKELHGVALPQDLHRGQPPALPQRYRVLHTRPQLWLSGIDNLILLKKLNLQISKLTFLSLSAGLKHRFKKYCRFGMICSGSGSTPKPGQVKSVLLNMDFEVC